MTNTQVTIIQIPIAVEFTCPHCGEDVEQPIDEFLSDQGLSWNDLSDWQYEHLKCPSCGKEIDDVTYNFD